MRMWQEGGEGEQEQWLVGAEVVKMANIVKANLKWESLGASC